MFGRFIGRRVRTLPLYRYWNPRIGDHFYTTKPSGKGTGLGLSICRRIVQAHGGAIALRESSGRGACFTVEFPVVSVEPEVAVGAGEPATPVPLTILVVDDEEGVRDYVATVLREAGHRVHEADGGSAALARVREAEVDLAFVDMRMPGMDGPECVRLLVAERGSLEGRVVHMSGDGVPTPEVPFLVKPMTPAEIHEAVRLATA